jgi:hypothetical protein
MKRFYWTLLKSILKRNSSTYLIAACIAVFITFPTVLSSVSASFFREIKDLRAKTYGGFDYIYFDSSDAQYEESFLFNPSQLEEKYYNSDQIYGAMYIVDTLYLQEQIFCIGYCDDNGIGMSHLESEEGRFPEKVGEIALTKELADSMESLTNIGDEVVLNGKNYTVTGIVMNYGRLWPKGSRQIQSGIDFVDAFVSLEEAGIIYKNTSYLSRLAMVGQSNTNVASGDGENWITNDNWYHGHEQDRQYYGSEIFETISCTSCGLLIVSVLYLSIRKTKRRYQTLWMLGLDRKRMIVTYSLELFIYSMLGGACGIIVSIIGDEAATAAMTGVLGREFLVSVDYWAYVKLLFYALLIVEAAGNVLFWCSDIRNFIPHRLHKSRRNTLTRLSFVEFRNVPLSFLMMVIVLSFSAAFYNYIQEFVDDYETKSAYVSGYAGQMPVDYDYELLASDLGTPYRMDDAVCCITTYEKRGIEDSDADALMTIDGVSQIKKYKATDKLLILKDPDIMNDYIDIADYIMDGEYNVNTVFSEIYDEGHKKLYEIMGYEENGIIQTLMNAYPENDVLLFEDYIVEGEINLEKLNSGEEVILVVPTATYREEIQNGRTVYVTGFSKSAKGVKADDELFHVGDTVTLSKYTSDEMVNAFVDEQYIKEHISRQDITVKIGAIIRNHVGWFENPYHELLPHINLYQFITTNEGFDQLGLDALYTRIRIYTEGSENTDQITSELMKYQAKYPIFEMYNATDQLLDYRELNMLVAILSRLLSILVMCSDMITFVIQLITKTRQNRYHYKIYRMNGFTKAEIAAVFVIQLLLIMAGSVLLINPMSHLLPNIAVTSTLLTRIEATAIFFAFAFALGLISELIVEKGALYESDN